MTELHTSLAQNIKKYRESLGITQDELSDRAGVAYSTVAKLEQGTIKNPTLLTVSALAASLEVTVDDLIEMPEICNTDLTGEQPIKFVYFDMNGVLVRFYHRAITLISRRTHLSIDKVENIFWHYNTAGNRGDISLAMFNKYMGEALHMKDFDWVKYYLEAVEPVSVMHEYLKKIQGEVDIGILTNTFPGLLKKMFELKLIPDMDYKAIIDSSEIGSVKPESKIFDLAEKAAGVKCGDILFVDDSRENLMAAERRGWRVLWFDDYHPEESLERIQEALNLKPN